MYVAVIAGQDVTTWTFSGKVSGRVSGTFTVHIIKNLQLKNWLHCGQLDHIARTVI